MSLALPARAKLNLDLEVLGRRDDGFHEIRTRLQAVALHDLLEVTPAGSSGTKITISGLEVPPAGDNIVLKAHAALEAAAGRELPTRFHLHKRIPPGSGLGGASSDAAAALRALAVLYRLRIDLAEIAPALGADVPFFLVGGTGLAEGKGERLTWLAHEPAWFAIAWPGIELPTAAVYRAWDELQGEPPNQLRRAATQVESRLQPFAEKLGSGWQMTGSGSAFFVRCATQDSARRAASHLDCWTAVTHAVGSWA